MTYSKTAFFPEKGWVGLIFLSGFLLRLAYLYQIKDNPTFYNLVLDCLAYDKWARDMAAGNWMGPAVFYQDPLYPYFLAVLYKTFGHDLFLTRIIQIVLGSLNGVFLYYIIRDIHGKKAAAIGGFIAAFYGPFLFYDGMINKPFLGIFLLNLSLLFFVSGIRMKNTARIFASGVGLGFFVLIRANAFLLIPLFAIWVYINFKGTQRITALLIFMIAFFLPIFPVTLHNYIGSGEFILTTSQGGQNFYIGNHPDNNTGTYRPPFFLRATPEFEEIDFKERAEFLSGRKLTPSEVSSFWTAETLRVIRSNPAYFLKNLGRKVLLFLNRHEVPDNHSYAFFSEYYSSILKWNPLHFGLIGALGLAGLFFSLFHNIPHRFSVFFPLFFLGYLISIVPFYIFSRYRLPVTPILIISSSYFIISLWEFVKAKVYGKMVLSTAVFLLFFLLVNAEVKKEEFSAQFGNIAYTFLQKGDHKQALYYYERAIEDAPGYAEPYYFVGRIYSELGDIPNAEKYFRKSIEIEPKLYVGYSGLGIVCAQRKKLEESGVYLQKALELRPYSPEAHNNLGMVYALLGNKEKARSEFEAALSLDPNFHQAEENLVRFQLK